MNPKKNTHETAEADFQFNNEHSTQWIRKNRPFDFPTKYKLDPEFVKIVDELKPWTILETKWFLIQKMTDGVHGFRHMCRVSINALMLLIGKYQTSKLENRAIMFACLLHDCRRENDKSDPDHGRRAEKWLCNNPKIIPREIEKYFDPIKFSIFFHNDDYSIIVQNNIYKENPQNKKFIDILKTSDALDRYRFPKHKWWLSEDKITLKPDLENKAFAFDLSTLSEEIFLRCGDSKKSIEEAWEKIKEGS